MSKQITITSRPPDIPSAAVGNFGSYDLPKASVGNFKGVMLCNRPNEMGGAKQVDSSGNVPFNSCVKHDLPTGWNPCLKPLPKREKKKKSNAVL